MTDELRVLLNEISKLDPAQKGVYQTWAIVGLVRDLAYYILATVVIISLGRRLLGNTTGSLLFPGLLLIGAGLAFFSYYCSRRPEGAAGSRSAARAVAAALLCGGRCDHADGAALDAEIDRLRDRSEVDVDAVAFDRAAGVLGNAFADALDIDLRPERDDQAQSLGADRLREHVPQPLTGRGSLGE